MNPREAEHFLKGLDGGASQLAFESYSLAVLAIRWCEAVCELQALQTGGENTDRNAILFAEIASSNAMIKYRLATGLSAI